MKPKRNVWPGSITLSTGNKSKKVIADLLAERASSRILSDLNFKYEYPAAETIKVTNADNATVTYNYRAAKGILEITDPNGNTTQINYYRRFDVAYNGKIRQIIDARKRTVAAYKYDNKTGNLICSSDIAGNETYFTYDKDGKLSLISRSEDNFKERPLLSFKRNQLALPTETALLDRNGKPAAVFKTDYNAAGDLSAFERPGTSPDDPKH